MYLSIASGAGEDALSKEEGGRHSDAVVGAILSYSR